MNTEQKIVAIVALALAAAFLLLMLFRRRGSSAHKLYDPATGFEIVAGARSSSRAIGPAIRDPRTGALSSMPCPEGARPVIDSGDGNVYCLSV